MSRHQRKARGRVTRRDFIGTTAGAAVLAGLGAPAFIREAGAQSSFNWKRHAGTKIDVLLVKNPRSELMQANEKLFTELTGIVVSSEQIPEQQQRQKAMIEFTSGKPTFDVAELSMHVQKRLSEKGRWLEDLRPYVADGSMTNPISTSPTSGAPASISAPLRTASSMHCRPSSITGSSTTTRNCSSRRASPTRGRWTRSTRLRRSSTIRRRAWPASSRAGSRTRTCPCGPAGCWARAWIRSRATASS